MQRDKHSKWIGTREPSVYADAAFVASCSADAAIAWLQKRDRPKPNFSDEYFPPLYTEWGRRAASEGLLDYILLRRKHPVINIALAKHSASQLVLFRLFASGVRALQIAVLQNPFLDSRTIPELDLPWGLFARRDWQFLRSYLANPALSLLFAASALKTVERSSEKIEGVTPGLPIELAGFFLKCLAENPRYIHLSSKEVEHPKSASRNTDWDELNEALGDMLQILPVNFSNAEGIRCILAGRIYQGQTGRPINRIYVADDKIDETIARWRADIDPEDVLKRRDVLRSPSFGSYDHDVYLNYLRLEIARAIVPPSERNFTSENPYRVAAFFSNFIPNEDLYWKEIDTDDFFARLEACQVTFEGLGFHRTPAMFICENTALLASARGREILERRLPFWEMEHINRWVDEGRTQRPGLFSMVARAEALEREKREEEAEQRLALQEKELFEWRRRISHKVSQLQGLALLILGAVITTSLLR